MDLRKRMVSDKEVVDVLLYGILIEKGFKKNYEDMYNYVYFNDDVEFMLKSDHGLLYIIEDEDYELYLEEDYEIDFEDVYNKGKCSDRECITYFMLVFDELKLRYLNTVLKF